jgi:cadmium resistance protein CadD (predicted permease)
MNFTNVFSAKRITLQSTRFLTFLNVPLFAHSTPAQVGIYLILFLLLVGLWCITGHTLSLLPGIAQILERTGSLMLPFLLIGLGLFILWKDSTFLMFFQLVAHH